MKFIEEKGNLFELKGKGYTFAHCVSIDNKWGKGIAVDFDKNFRGMKSYCGDIINKNGIKSPSVIYYSNDKDSVFNLYTKEKYYKKPTYITITECINIMQKICADRNIKKLAMPRIGCGLDNLKWCVVREIIKSTFENYDIEIIIRRL